MLYDFVKAGAIRLAYAMAWDLVGTGVTALAVSPGFLRSEVMLDRFGVAEANWRDATKAHPDFAFSETPHYVGRAIAALAGDPEVARKSGMAFFVDALADEYGFTDLDGSRPAFWRNMEAWLDGELAKGELDQRARWVAAARYAHIHTAPERRDQARRYAAGLDGQPLL